MQQLISDLDIMKRMRNTAVDKNGNPIKKYIMRGSKLYHYCPLSHEYVYVHQDHNCATTDQLINSYESYIPSDALDGALRV